MAILLIAVVSVAALVVGTLTQLMILVWIALGLCLAGLALIVIRSVLRRQRAVTQPNAEEDADDGSDDSAATAVDGSVSDGGGLSEEEGETSDNTDLRSTVDDTADDTDPAGHDAHSAGADAQPRAGEESRVDDAAVRKQLVTEAGRVTQDSAVAEEHSRATTLVADRDKELVRVVAGRRRYHLADCRLLGSRSYAEITRAEAADEGFTACTTCCG